MTMVQIGKVTMAMSQWLVPMPMAMRFAVRLARPVVVLVMRVMDVTVFMFERFMAMVMLMALTEVQPDADSHQRGGNQQRYRNLLAEQSDC